ncbi:MAG: Ppx/GppA phosphatase family protein [Pseudomonadota bacterium]
MTWSTANCAERAFSRRRRAYGALDLGSNNCRLMIAVPRRRGFSVVDSFSRIVRLGEGIATTGRISAAAEERALEALRRCAEVAARWDLAGIRCVTTDAVRSAANGAAFVERVRAETGLSLTVIGAEEEAALAVRGCAGLVDRSAKQAIVFDIGGGSTEISFTRALHRRGQEPALKLTHMVSLPFGVVRLSDGLAPGGFAGMHYDGIRKRVADVIRVHCDAEAFRTDDGHLIGTSGTSTSLAALAKGLTRYRRREIDGSWLSGRKIEDLIAKLFMMGLEGRQAQPCIGSGRADLIMPGCAILQGILDATGCDRVRVADRGLREGLISEMLTQSADVRSRRGQPRRGAAVPAE